ncbi:ketosteroid isomerase-like protein [Naumannella cuiyingiana]|uniref:Ketosteroid isomerase-like protein n=1 Tax=Naumannella cuiyingiana TaxID=1347891 RepID=A0A7Z0DAK3_9ACTN|nr:nuclear transport factor 2 family protein [Naumannella cuiyingiana]NYI72029.1 ketosteroid isomerase-like protein [Naumannella cuiyingiana]
MDSTRLARDYVELLEARDWERWGALLHPDVVYLAPQTRERVGGREELVRFNQRYPGEWHLRVARLHADVAGAAIWMDVSLDGEPQTGLVWLTIGAGSSGEPLITEVVDFWPQPYDIPERRRETPAAPDPGPA